MGILIVKDEWCVTNAAQVSKCRIAMACLRLMTITVTCHHKGPLKLWVTVLRSLWASAKVTVTRIPIVQDE